MRTAASILALLLLASAARGEDPPLVAEHVDAIAILTVEDNQYSRVLFFKNDALLANRLLLDDMEWYIEDGQFQLVWQDYSIAERVVTADTFEVYHLEYDPTQCQRAGPWWCMFRNMRDLKQP